MFALLAVCCALIYNKNEMRIKEYAWFVAKVREKQNELDSLEAAVDAALGEMPEEYAIHAFLLSNKAEVKRMCITKYNEARTLAEEREEGRKEGREEGTIKTLVRLIRMGMLAENDAAKAAGMSETEFKRKAALFLKPAQ